MNVVVHRSPLRLLGYAVLSVPAILLAIDMTISHRWYPEPDSVDQVVGSTVAEDGQTVQVTESVLTIDGKAEMRRDLAIASLLLVGGLGTMAWATLGLLRPRALLRAGDDGISVRVDGRGRPPRLLPWDSILEVRSGVRDAEGTDLPVLSIRLRDPAMVPADPAGGVADPPWLHLWAEDWATSPLQLAPLLDQRARRR